MYIVEDPYYSVGSNESINHVMISGFGLDEFCPRFLYSSFQNMNVLLTDHCEVVKVIPSYDVYIFFLENSHLFLDYHIELTSILFL